MIAVFAAAPTTAPQHPIGSTEFMGGPDKPGHDEQIYFNGMVALGVWSELRQALTKGLRMVRPPTFMPSCMSSE